MGLDSDIRFIEIPFASPDYREALRLREDFLRKPLGLAFSEADLAKEAISRHFGLLSSHALVACVMAVPLGDGRMQIRQMVVREAFQGKGYGRRLLRAAEAAVRETGCRFLVLNAREAAIGFYRNLEYQPVGQPFLDLGIVHQRMEKILAVCPGLTGSG